MGFPPLSSISFPPRQLSHSPKSLTNPNNIRATFSHLFYVFVVHQLALEHILTTTTMAPSLEEPINVHSYDHLSFKHAKPSIFKQSPSKPVYEPGLTPLEDHLDYEYNDLRPHFPDLKWPALEEVPYHERGLEGDSRFRNLLDSATDVFDYNPKIGTEVSGVNLAKLTDAQKNDLARLISIRGVVFFRNQRDFDIDAQRKLGQYYGTLHKHATTGVPKRPGLEDVHVVYTDEKSKEQRAFFAPSYLWHSDVSLSIPRKLFETEADEP